MARTTYSFVRSFEPAPTQQLCFDHHYLLCVSRGVVRLEADRTVWTLPPARAALVTAGKPIDVTILQPVVSASVLVDPGFAPPPPSTLSVFDLTPLARALITECGRWGESDDPLPDSGAAMFGALVVAAWELAEHPSPARMPAATSPELRRAIALTETRLADEPRVDDIAGEVGLAPRSLARRFEHELGMTWRATLRRLRVLRAIELLADPDTTVTTVATSVGYSSLSAFQLAFRDLTGQSPSEYQRGMASGRA